MALSYGNLLLFLVTCLAQNTPAQDNFGIVDPFPDNIFPLEFTSAQVTCAAFDSTGIKTPDRIQFMRKDQFADYTQLTENDNLHFTNRTKMVSQGGQLLKKLFVTMFIKNVTMEDDTQYGALGRYECHAFAVGDNTPRKHGFSVNVIQRKEIPSVHVIQPGILQHGDNVTIVCNVTIQAGKTPLQRISWFKNGILLQMVRCPDPSSPRDYLPPLVIKNAGTKDGGSYTCLLEVLLRNIRQHNVSDVTEIKIAPWFDKPKEDLKFEKKKGKHVSFECAAQGFPLEVEWQAESFKSGTLKSSKCINESDDKYHIERKGNYEPYMLTVSALQSSDSGFYYCCLSSNCSSSDLNKDNCQRFVLNVNGQSPTGPICKSYLLAMVILSTILIYARNEF